MKMKQHSKLKYFSNLLAMTLTPLAVWITYAIGKSNKLLEHDWEYYTYISSLIVTTLGILYFAIYFTDKNTKGNWIMYVMVLVALIYTPYKILKLN